MRMKQILLSVSVIVASVGLAIPSWAQDTPRGSSQPGAAQPAPSEPPPGSRAGTSQELSQNDMRLIQQRLEEKGYPPGNRDGTADETTRAAIRKFQQDEGIPTTGRIDEVTANRLGFRYAKGPAGSSGAGERSTPAERPSGR
jgi:peptidoglycan hydrolase-like protein with peptidoglycan-binding domain